MCSENPPPPSAQWPGSLPPPPCRGGLCALSGAVATFPTSLALIGEARPFSVVALPPPGLLLFHRGAAVQLGRGGGGGHHRGVYQLLATLICYECHVYAAKLFDFLP